MLERIIRIIKLDFPVFKDIESDPKATTEAAIVVAVASVLSAIGSAFASERPVMAFLGGVIGGVLGWIVWSYVSYFVGSVLYKSQGTFEKMLRVIGYANAPQLLGIFNIIPCVGWIAGLAGAILALIASVMAIREGLDLDTGQAIIVALVGWFALLLVSIIVGSIFGVGAAITGAITGALSR
jgi:hypothetical protein